MKKAQGGKPKKNQKPKKGCGRRRIALAAVLLVALLLGGLYGWMALQARITHVRKAVVYLDDLPQALDGTTLLYISDLNIRGAGDARRTQRLMNKLNELQPDVLLLGGDYCGGKILDGRPDADEGGQAAALSLLRSLNSFNAPLGKYAVAGEQDQVLSGLKEALFDGGVTLLDDGCATIEKSGGPV